MKYLLIAVPVFCYSLLASSQQLSYQPFQKDAKAAVQLLAEIDTRYKSDMTSFSGSYKKETLALYKERAEYVKQLVQEEELVTDATAANYLKAVTKQIFLANPSLNPSGLRIYFSRSYLPNASSMGEGTIIFHIGLFSRLDNEAQMAFVLCHELAHYFLNHGNNSINRYVQTVNSDDFQKQLKQIKKSEFGQNSQLDKLVLTLSFKNRRHSREFEQAADSMALTLLKNTGYDVNEILSCLALLDSIDKLKSADSLSLETQLNFPAYPFKKRWITSNSLAFTDSNEDVAKKEKLADSLKTHPDCSRRITQLQEAVRTYRKSDSKKFIISEASFQNLQNLFELEALEYCFERDKVSLCLFFTMKMLSAQPQNPYLLATAGRCMNKIYTAQKDHTLGKIADLPGPGFDEDYNLLLKLLQSLRLTELAAIQYYFLQTHQEAGKVNEEFLNALIHSKDYFEKPEEKKEWIGYYYSQFPKHKYSF